LRELDSQTRAEPLKPMHETSTISVVVPTLNSAETIRKCLDSIIKQNYPKTRIEILLVDGGSHDGTLDIAGEYPIKIIAEPRKGRGSAYDRGFREAKNDYVAYLDSDAVASVNWLNSAVHILEQDSSIAVVNFKSLAPRDSSYFQRCVDALLSRDCGGANGAVYRREALEKIDGFNKFLYYNQEDYANIRLLEQGYKTRRERVPAIWHYRRRNIRSYFAQCVESGIGSMKLFLSVRRGSLLVRMLARTMVAVFPLVSVALMLFLWNSLFWIPPLINAIGALSYIIFLFFVTDPRYRSIKYVIPATFLMWLSTLGNLFGYLAGLRKVRKRGNVRKVP